MRGTLDHQEDNLRDDTLVKNDVKTVGSPVFPCLLRSSLCSAVSRDTDAKADVDVRFSLPCRPGCSIVILDRWTVIQEL
jgi:hypothetical protein